MNINEVIQSIDSQVRRLIQDWDVVSADELGLDLRAGYELHVSRDGIIVAEDYDRVLQYYGGFEYVKPMHRQLLGEWVFYSSHSDRVQECLDHLNEKEDA